MLTRGGCYARIYLKGGAGWFDLFDGLAFGRTIGLAAEYGATFDAVGAGLVDAGSGARGVPAELVNEISAYSTGAGRARRGSHRRAG